MSESYKSTYVYEPPKPPSQPPPPEPTKHEPLACGSNNPPADSGAGSGTDAWKKWVGGGPTQMGC